MTVSQSWLTAALEASADAPTKTERVAMWIAGHYPAEGLAKFTIAQVREACRIRSVTGVFDCLTHLKKADLIDVVVSPDGLHYCVTSSHLIDQKADTNATERRCDTKCDSSIDPEGSHYTGFRYPLKGIQILVASKAATVGSSPKRVNDGDWRWFWTEWKNRRLGWATYGSGMFGNSQGQYSPAIKAKSIKLVQQFGKEAISAVLDELKVESDRSKACKNFDTMVRSHLEGMLEDYLDRTETAVGSTIGGSPDSPSTSDIEKAVKGISAIEGLVRTYGVRFERRGSQVAWLVDPYIHFDMLSHLRSVVIPKVQQVTGQEIIIERAQ